MPKECKRAPRNGHSLGKARTPAQALSRLLVRPCLGSAAKGKLIAGPVVIRCALGRSGIRRTKREGDGATPAGTHKVIQGYFRQDRLNRTRSNILMIPIGKSFGWCDDSASAAYNRLVRRPFRGGHEALWREDALYDTLLVMDYNLAPALRGRGSAIFLHLATTGFGATAGCVAIAASDMRRLLPRIRAQCRLDVSGF